MSKKPPSKLARKLKSARAKVEETQEQFAKRLGVPTRTLINWENSEYSPRPFALEALNAKLDSILKA